MTLHGKARLLLLAAAAMVALPTALAKSCQTPFEPLNDEWCVHAFITSPRTGHTWPSARQECQKLQGDLVVVDTHEKMQALYLYLAEKYPGEKSLPYWVGGSSESGQWQWVNGSPISLASHLWVPPSPGGGFPSNAYTLLIKAGTKRRYMDAVSSTLEIPAYICEE